MQCSPHELKEKLLKGLDEENNVVDMATVVAVISILEKYPMSREALEQTRIGRYVNELRKKTKNEQLAKRAKKLVKNWQHLINSDNPIVNGDNGERLVHPNVANLQSPSLGSLSPAYVKSSQVKRLPGSKPTTPSLPSSKPNTPTLQQKVKPNTPAIKSKPNTPSMPQYFKQTLSPSLRSTPTSSPRLHSTPKFAISPNMTFSNDSRSPAVSLCLLAVGHQLQ
ncbi:MED26 [Mytilus coruscus]|uniref:Mediator of RNA polymerase II transcription subunit 26 n=1 Tax=Mytilus coruscus TaxID=42192 RepID=A0A6J8ETB9_MYTCO|nr:MED26 [Mytilus coruscus]